MISTWHQWRRLCSLRSRTGMCHVCAGYCCCFYTIRFGRKFSAILFLLVWQWPHDFISIRYVIFSPFLSAFLTGTPLDINHIYCWFCTFRRTKIYQPWLFVRSILFKSIQSFSPCILHFVYCFDNCLLLALVDVLVLIDLDSLPAYTCKRALWFSAADETQFQSRSATAQGTRPRNKSLGLNLTDYEEVEYVGLILEAIQEQTRRPRTICLTSGKIVIYVYMKDWILLVEIHTVQKSFCFFYFTA